MKAFSRALDRFCYKHPNFGIPKLMLYIVLGNLAVFIFMQMDRTHTFINFLYFNPALIMKGQVWRLITFIFIPTSDSILWEAVALYFYYSLGNSLEMQWGYTKFTLYYLCGILFTMVYGIFYTLISGGSASYLYSFDATYINLSLFLAFAVLYPDAQVLIMFIIPVKVKYMAILAAVPYVLALFINPFPANLLPLIALMNFFLFCGEYFINYFRPVRARNTKQAINFRAAVRKLDREQKNAPYKHKCSVCGKTDTEYPNLEFRYCSKCSGYHCFCIDHINNHVHFN